MRGEWIVQLRDAFPLPRPCCYVVFDHDSKFGAELELFRRTQPRVPYHYKAKQEVLGRRRRFWDKRLRQDSDYAFRKCAGRWTKVAIRLRANNDTAIISISADTGNKGQSAGVYPS